MDRITLEQVAAAKRDCVAAENIYESTRPMGSAFQPEIKAAAAAAFSTAMTYSRLYAAYARQEASR
jgi:hypothetical protein